MIYLLLITRLLFFKNIINLPYLLEPCSLKSISCLYQDRTNPHMLNDYSQFPIKNSSSLNLLLLVASYDQEIMEEGWLINFEIRKRLEKR